MSLREKFEEIIEEMQEDVFAYVNSGAYLKGTTKDYTDKFLTAVCEERGHRQELIRKPELHDRREHGGPCLDCGKEG